MVEDVKIPFSFGLRSWYEFAKVRHHLYCRPKNTGLEGHYEHLSYFILGQYVQVTFGDKFTVSKVSFTAVGVWQLSIASALHTRSLWHYVPGCEGSEFHLISRLGELIDSTAKEKTHCVYGLVFRHV